MYFRYLFIVCKATGHYKYSCGLLETILQSVILPNHLRDQLVNHRFVNTRGEVDSNIPLDLLMEHENKAMKEDLRAYRGTYTQNHLDGISKGSNLMGDIIRSIDRQYGYYISKGEGTKQLNQSDIKVLVDKYITANLFTATAGRSHSPSLSFINSNVMKILTRAELDAWMKERLTILKTKNYYKQFCNFS